MTRVGRVVAIRRFPVKSMAGEELDEAEVGWTGLGGDRQYAFVRAGNHSHFPWFTGRQWPGLVLCRAAYDGDRVAVTGPDDARRDVTDPALLAALEAAGGHKLTLMRLARGCYDAMPVSVITTSLLRTVAAAHGAAPDALRFRANLLVEAADGADEREWAGRDLAVGGVRLRATYPTGRCAMIAVDPATAERDPSLLRTVAQKFDGTCGLYAAVAAPGRVGVGDAVSLA